MNDRFLLVAAALMLIPGCPTNNSASDTGANDSGTVADAAVSVDAPTDTGAPAADRVEPFAIGAIQEPASGSGIQRNLSALFSENPCDRASVGPCTLTTCPTPPNDGGLPADTNVGTITVSGGQLAAPMMLVPNASTGAYRGMFNVAGALFAAGDTLTFETSAGSTRTELAAPSTIALTAPMLTASTVVDRGTDLRFAWTTSDAAPAGNVLVSALSFGGPPGASFMACTFPVAAGSGVVPAAALQLFQVGSANITVSSQSATVIDAAGIRTRIELTNSVGATQASVRVQ